MFTLVARLYFSPLLFKFSIRELEIKKSCLSITVALQRTAIWSTWIVPPEMTSFCLMLLTYVVFSASEAKRKEMIWNEMKFRTFFEKGQISICRVWSSFIANLALHMIPRARMDSESMISHEAEGRMDCWLKGHEGERNNCFSKIQLVGQREYRVKASFPS